MNVKNNVAFCGKENRPNKYANNLLEIRRIEEELQRKALESSVNGVVRGTTKGQSMTMKRNTLAIIYDIFTSSSMTFDKAIETISKGKNEKAKQKIQASLNGLKEQLNRCKINSNSAEQIVKQNLLRSLA